MIARPLAAPRPVARASAPPMSGQQNGPEPEGLRVATAGDRVRGHFSVPGRVLAAELHRGDEQVRHHAGDERPRQPGDGGIVGLEDRRQQEQHARADHDGLRLQVPEQDRRLPEIPALCLPEEEGGVARQHHGGRDGEPGQDRQGGREVAHLELGGHAGEEPQPPDDGGDGQEDAADRQPRSPVDHRRVEEEPEPVRALEVPDQENRGDEQEELGQEGRHRGDEQGSICRQQEQQGADEEGARRDGLRPQVGPDLPAPRPRVRGVVGQPGAGHRVARQLGGGLEAQRVRVGPQVGALDRRRERIQHGLVRADVVHVRPGALLGRPHVDRRDAQELADTACRVVDVAHPDGLGGAHLDARRFEADVDAVRAEVALRGGMGVVIDVDRVVRTGLHARLAADASLIVEVHDAVVADEQRLRRACLDAGRVRAVIAPHDAHLAGRGRVLALLHVLDPRTELADWNVVLGLAGDGAGVAADARPLINGEAISH